VALERADRGITDPAELFAVGTRITGRLGWTHPDIAGFLAGAGLAVLDIPTGLAPRALRDIQAGQAAGRFTVPDVKASLSLAEYVRAEGPELRHGRVAEVWQAEDVLDRAQQ
jgi:hypothetical protein